MRAQTHNEVGDAARAAFRRDAHGHIECILWREPAGVSVTRDASALARSGHASASDAALLRAMAGINSRRRSISSCVVAKLTCGASQAAACDVRDATHDACEHRSRALRNLRRMPDRWFFCGGARQRSAAQRQRWYSGGERAKRKQPKKRTSARSSFATTSMAWMRPSKRRRR
jgi:hypothetical protein